MADKMMRIAGRDSTGAAKAIKTDQNGNIGINLAGSQSVQLANTEQTAAAGQNLSVSAVANNVLSKTAYVFSEKDGYAGIDIKLNTKWVSLLAARNEFIKDDFTGADTPVDATKWEIVKIGTYNDLYTYGKYLADKLRLGLRSNSGTSNIFLTSKNKISATTERIVEFVVNESQFPVGINSELNFGFTPTKPVDTTSIAGRSTGFRIREGKVLSIGTAVVEYILPEIRTSARYALVSTPSEIKIYRDGVLIITNPRVLTEAEYHIYFQLTASTAAATREVDVDSLAVWSKNEDAKVTANKLWAKTTTDVIPSEMRVVFQNDLVGANAVSILLMGQP